MSKKAYIRATWRVGLDCTCPYCGKVVNLLDFVDFWEGLDLKYGEASDLEYVMCPNCDKDFECAFEV